MKMMARHAAGLVVALLSVLAFGWLGAADIQAAKPVVFIDPPSADATAGGSAQFAVSIENATDASGFAFIVEFDPEVIRVEEITLVSFMTGCSVQVNKVDPGAGEADFACITLPLAGSSGSGVLAEVSFTCLRGGANIPDLAKSVNYRLDRRST